MSAEAAYIHSSAFVKLANGEAESAALEGYLLDWRMASSDLLRVEAIRALARVGSDAARAGRARLSSVNLVPIDSGILEAAALLDPLLLGSLDAIHLATARALGSDLGVVVTYDRRVSAAAEALGLTVASPT